MSCPYGFNKWHKPNTAQNWKYIINRRVNTQHKGNPEAQKKALLEEHEKLKARIGPEQYNKDFPTTDKYVNLNNASTQAGTGIYHQPYNPNAATKGVAGPSGVKRAAATKPPGQQDKKPKEADPLDDGNDNLFEDIRLAEATPPSSPSKETAGASQVVPETPDKMAGEPMDVAPAASQDSGQGSQPAPAPAADDGTIGSGGGSGSATTSRHIVVSQGLTVDGKIWRTFTRKFRIKTWGNADFKQERTISGSNVTQELHTVSQCVLPTEMIWFYLPPAVYKQLWDTRTMEHKVTKVGVVVTPIGPTVNFNTNEGATGVAAPSHIVYGSASIGLNKIIPCDMVDITRSDTAPMVITGATNKWNHNQWLARLWGNSPDIPASDRVMDTAARGKIIIPGTYLRMWQPPQALGLATAVGNGEVAGTNRILMSNYPLEQLLPVQTMKHFETQSMPIIDFQWKVQRPYNLGAHSIIYDNTPLRSSDTARRLRIWQRYSSNQNSAKTYLEGANTGFLGTIVDNDRTNSSKNPRFVIDGLQSAVTNSDYYVLYTTATVENQGLDVNDKQQTKSLGQVAQMPMVTFGIEAVQGNTPGTAPGYINLAYDYMVETSITIITEQKDPWFYWPGVYRAPTGTSFTPVGVPTYPVHKYYSDINELAPLWANWSTTSSGNEMYSWNTPAHMGLQQGGQTLGASFTSFPEGAVTIRNFPAEDRRQAPATAKYTQYKEPKPIRDYAVVVAEQKELLEKAKQKKPNV